MLVRLRVRPGLFRPRPHHGGSRQARGHGRLHRHLGAAGGQLQRTGARDPRGRALRLSRHGRGPHPDERRLPQADQHRGPGGHDAVAALSGGGRRRQCRGEPGRHELPVRGARRDGRRPGHDEQPDLRQRYLSVLRNDLLRLAGGPGLGRDGRRPHPHDEFAPDRPGGAWSSAIPWSLEDFHIRKGSGGRGKWHAGDGTERRIRFLERMDLALLTSHRRVPPFGAHGGEPGQVGQNSVRRRDGRIEALGGCDQTVMEPGDAIIIRTPTAGGFGRA
ncbi:hydantoinase B/oxoprolinase family protein [Micromonospora sp. STR1s_5]|nr:hydantoinase B/oxoprolinase family protein [Micromonospora sp. STR1s_5]